MNDTLGIAGNIYNGQVAAGFVDVLGNRTSTPLLPIRYVCGR
ncbi:hypothetical protein [Niallia taxi]|nr:hypothetical protein [Niallia taxi]